MPIQVNYLDNGIGIEIIASGIVTGAEIIDAHEEIYNEENLKRQKYQIVDRTCCTQYQVYAEEIEVIAELDNRASEENPDIIIAVVSPTSLQFGMTRMWQAYLKENRLNTKIFPTREKADTWIRSYLNSQFTPGN
jgi:hypothetical protein